MAEYQHSLVNDGRGGKIPFPPFITQREMDIITNEFEVLDGDVFVVTYPRSGTTWTEQIIHLLLNNGEQGSKVLGDAVPWVETAAKYWGMLFLGWKRLPIENRDSRNFWME